ncbi:MAG: membrane protein insertase Oxa1/YidC/SpoIIIJ [bacterium]|jgi:membrane protein insertase Oxa1/YidC/SpoIIIJ
MKIIQHKQKKKEKGENKKMDNKTLPQEKKESVISNFVSLLIAITFLFLAFFVLFYMNREAYTLLWKSDILIPTKAYVYEAKVSVRIIDVSTNNSSHKEVQYSPLIRYRYMIKNGVSYKASNHLFSSEHSKRSDAQKELRGYSKGQRIQIFYDPDHPQYSTFDKDIPISSGIVLFFVFTLIGSVMFYIHSKVLYLHYRGK